jgi:hypothetical protein
MLWGSLRFVWLVSGVRVPVLGVDEAMKKRLFSTLVGVGLCLQAMNPLLIAAGEETRAALPSTAITPEKIEATIAELAEPAQTLDMGLTRPLEEIEQQLQKAQAELAGADTRRADLERSLEYQRRRPAAIGKRLAEAKLQEEQVTAALGAPPVTGESPVPAQAERWVLETRHIALSAEIKMLDQELLSQPLRVKLLEARRDREELTVDRRRQQLEEYR